MTLVLCSRILSFCAQFAWMRTHSHTPWRLIFTLIIKCLALAYTHTSWQLLQTHWFVINRYCVVNWKDAKEITARKYWASGVLTRTRRSVKKVLNNETKWEIYLSGFESSINFNGKRFFALLSGLFVWHCWPWTFCQKHVIISLSLSTRAEIECRTINIAVRCYSVARL